MSSCESFYNAQSSVGLRTIMHTVHCNYLVALGSSSVNRPKAFMSISHNPTMEIKTTLQWISSWRDSDSETLPRTRFLEYANIHLVVHEGHHRIMIDDKLDAASSWLYYHADGHYFLALKLTTISRPHHMRYYGFKAHRCPDGKTCYLCQHSTHAEDNPSHTCATYMQKFLASEMKREQSFHISMVQL